ncbi:phosphatase PAP2 family protein [Peribacillus sp. NPDC097264]|uniref:phosphatase PAP2 family protein n=1 Tax=Peribacillus sp. NPDC097264 TaxID=3390616 RepID=UPI003CFCF782
MKKNMKILYPLSYLLLFILTSFIYSIINQLPSDAVDVTTKIDEGIPFIKEFIIPYLLWYPFMYGLLIYYCFVDRKQYFVAISSLISGKLICFVVYVFWQTTVPRPDVVGDDIFANLVRFIYMHDQPVNCLPSIHVMTTFIMMIIVYNRKEDFKREYACVTVMGTLIILSTLFTKQHAILDALAGILVACAVYAAAQFMFNGGMSVQVNHIRTARMKNRMKNSDL